MGSVKNDKRPSLRRPDKEELIEGSSCEENASPTLPMAKKYIHESPIMEEKHSRFNSIENSISESVSKQVNKLSIL